MFFSAAIMGFLMMSFTFIDPVKDFSLLLYISVLFGFFSATFDIAFDAFRIDSISKEKQGYASACAVMGYRIGMIIAGTLGLILSDFYSWNYTFMLIGVIFFISLIYIPFLTEPKLESEQYKTIIEKVKASVIEPFKDFLTRKNAFIILFAVIIYKLGGVLLSLVSIPFYLELGYSKIQVAAIAKFIGLFATIFGSFIGGYFVAKAGHLSALIICGIIQALVHTCFIWLHHAPVEHFSLLITIIIENLGSGAGTTAEVAYLSYLCNKKYSATQYALLSSLAVLMNSIISIKSGSIVDLIGWDLFFILTVLLSFPAIIIFAYLRKQE
jgi:PAT family beta-lactamase induction signal transducer AmpG